MIDNEQKLSAAERKRAKMLAQILKAEREWRTQTGADPTSPPELRLETQQALRQLGVTLSASEQFTLALDGRDAVSVTRENALRGFTPTMPSVDENPNAQLERELRSQIEQEELATMSPARASLYLFQKQQREAEADAIRQAEQSQETDARRPWREYLESLVDKMQNDRNFSDEDLRKVHKALAQVNTPGSCHDTCLALIGEANRAEIASNSEYRALLESEAAEASRTLADFIAETSPKPADPGDTPTVEATEPAPAAPCEKPIRDGKKVELRPDGDGKLRVHLVDAEPTAA